MFVRQAIRLNNNWLDLIRDRGKGAVYLFSVPPTARLKEGAKQRFSVGCTSCVSTPDGCAFIVHEGDVALKKALINHVKGRASLSPAYTVREYVVGSHMY